PYWQLDWIVRRSDPADRYAIAQIRKRRGGKRLILMPRGSLVIVQRKLLQVLSNVYRPRLCVHGFVTDRSIVSNAQTHIGRTWVLNVDLHDFFPTIHFGRVRGLFQAPPYSLPLEVATLL